MWMVNPSLLCDKHLLGEHVELHMLAGCILKNKSIKGFLDKKIVNPSKIYERHKDIVKEMKKRGFNHRSDLPDLSGKELPACEVNVEKSVRELFSRCEKCRARKSD
jgi:hypothetical protein